MNFSPNLVRANIITGLQDNYATYASFGYGSALVPPGISPKALGVTPGGNLVTGGECLNNGAITRIDGSDLSLIDVHQYPSSPTSVIGGYGFATVTHSGTDYAIDNGTDSIFGFSRQLVTSANGVETYNEEFAESTVVATGRGKAGTNYGYYVKSTTAAGVKVNKVTLPTPAVTLLHTIVAVDVDATATAIFCRAVATDETDGHPILYITTTAGTAPAYVVKVDKDAGTIIWIRALAAVASINNHTWNQTVINNRRLFIVSGSPNRVTTVNTSDGSSTSFTSGLEGLTFQSGQVSNDDLRCLVLSCEFTEGTDSPTLLNSTPSIFAQSWAVLYVASPPLGPSEDGWFTVCKPFQL